MRTPRFKRIIDLIVAGLGLLLCALPILVIAGAIRVFMGSPVVYRQLRPGLNGRPFTMYKFRTMLNLRDAPGNPYPDHLRLTKLGTFLRRTSLDELPELINVLKGDMSVVGPRPLLMEYLERYNPQQARRHEVLPGITGWAQVNGRNALSWDEKFTLDVWYVDHWSIGLDLKIMARTLVQISRRKGISADGHATMPTFTGNRGEHP